MNTQPVRAFVLAAKSADLALSRSIAAVAEQGLGTARPTAIQEAQLAVSLLEHARTVSRLGEYATFGTRGATGLSRATDEAVKGIDELRGGDKDTALMQLGEAREAIARMKTTVPIDKFLSAADDGTEVAVDWARVRNAMAGNARYQKYGIPATVDEQANQLLAGKPNTQAGAAPAATPTGPTPAPTNAAAAPGATPTTASTAPTAATPPTAGAAPPPANVNADGIPKNKHPRPTLLGPEFPVIDEASEIARYGRDITEEAAEGKLPPLIGRANEINQVAQILNQLSKNNAMLLGEPGVGKTAIVEGLAQRIVKGDVPPSLQGRRIVAIDLSKLMSGSGVVGELEKRIAPLMKEIEDAEGKIIPFVDEMHQMNKAAGQTGTFGDLIKPQLSRGKTRMIGATTTDEYRKIVQKDKALDRRFQPVTVDEPTVDETEGILRLLAERYERHHGVSVHDSALRAAAEYSNRYVGERFLPDKAIDLLDNAGSTLGLQKATRPMVLDVASRQRDEVLRQVEVMRRRALPETDKAFVAARDRLTNLDEQIDEYTRVWQRDQQFIARFDELRDELAAAYAKNDARAIEAATGKVEALRAEARVAWKETPPLVPFEVDENAIAIAVSQRTGIPVSRMTEDEAIKLLQLEDRLGSRVFEQPEAVSAVARAIRRGRSGLADPNRPMGSFIFLGPTGVGKTELSKALADSLFDDARSLVRLDMSEYMEKHAISRLFGAPPGYVGYDEGGQLTEAVRKNPFSVVLLDEIEKAHPDVFNTLLQVLDDGRLTDGQGRVVDFRNVVLIMTSNASREALKANFRPEFLNRVDEIVTFNPLSQQGIARVVDAQLARVGERLTNRGYALDVTDRARAELARVGYDPEYGARPVKRAVQRYVEDPLAEASLRGELQVGDTALIDHSGIAGELMKVTRAGA